MSLTIDSILNFNSCEVENGFFEPPVSNSNGVNLHISGKLSNHYQIGFKLQRSKFKFHRPCRAI